MADEKEATVWLAAPASEPRQQAPSSRIRAILTILSLTLGTFLYSIDTTIIAVAVPRISADFEALGQVGWYGSTFLLLMTSFQPIFGSIYKSFDEKIVYLVSIIIFEVGSTICAAAPSSPIFILGRAIAGTGTAGLIQGALAIITVTSPLETRPRNLAIVMSSFAVATPLAPSLGGIITQRATWRWCFWLNLPAGFCIWLLVFTCVRIPAHASKLRNASLSAKIGQLDFLGALLLLGSVCSLFLVLQWGGDFTWGWNSFVIIGLFVGFGVIFTIFLVVQWKLGEKAMVPLRIFTQRSVAMGSSYLFFAYLSTYIWDYYLPFFFQGAQGDSPIISGIRMLPISVSCVLAIMISGALTSTTGIYVSSMIAGQVVSAVGTGLMIKISSPISIAMLAGFQIVAAFGLGFAMQLPFTAIQVALSEEDISVANGVLTLVGQLGGAIGICISESLFINSLLYETSLRDLNIPRQALLSAGATNLSQIGPSSSILNALRQCYAIAVSRTLICSTVAACIAIPCACCMQWLDVKDVAQQRLCAVQAPETETPPEDKETRT